MRACLLRLATGVVALVGAAALVPLACSSDTTPGECEGVTFDGVCEGKCVPDKCLHDDAGAWRNTCVTNRCVLVCDKHSECDNFAGLAGELANTQSCMPKKEDDTGADVLVCFSNGKALGFGKKCPAGDECAVFSACPGGEPCGNPCGDDPANACVRDSIACRGVADCQLGRCAATQVPCRLSPACDEAACAPLECASAGEGDPNAYCTRFDCDDDGDCPGGFRCGVRRDPHEICGSSPKKGDDAFCGATDEPCIDLAAPPPGRVYVEGADCLQRRACLVRGPCAPCEADVDCSRVDDQVCARQDDGSKGCGRLCETDADCESPDYRCDAQQKACVHRFGACKGSGAFCEPCNDDLDCGPEASCVSGGCIAIPLAIPCTTDDDCPLAPSGKRGHCITDLASPDYQKCTLPISSGTTAELGCW